LLELVEDQVALGRAGELGGDALERARPGVVQHDGRAGCLLAEVADDGRAEQRRLPDSALAVEDRQPGREQVRDHDLALVLAAEEEERVELRVVEGGQALEGRHWRRREKAHAGTGAVASTCWARLLTYSSSGCSSRSTSRERQNS